MKEEMEERQETIGELLKRLRGNTSLRAVQRTSGISNAYLSQVEKGLKRPGPRILRKLAALYNVSVQQLFSKAGYLDRLEGEPPVDEAAEVERAYQYVLSRPRLPCGHPTPGHAFDGVKTLHCRAVREIQRKEASVMRRDGLRRPPTGQTAVADTPDGKLNDFCHYLMHRGSGGAKLQPAAIAREFVDYFGFSPFPRMDEIREKLKRAGIRIEITGRETGGLRGHHVGTRDGGLLHRTGPPPTGTGPTSIPCSTRPTRS